MSQAYVLLATDWNQKRRLEDHNFLLWLVRFGDKIYPYPTHLNSRAKGTKASQYEKTMIWCRASWWV